MAVDPIGSIVYDRFNNNNDTESRTYRIEGIGEDFIPDNYDFSVIDDIVQVADQESFLMTRELLRKEAKRKKSAGRVQTATAICNSNQLNASRSNACWRLIPS